jgi:predicted RNase H-like HicB family nuclease
MKNKTQNLKFSFKKEVENMMEIKVKTARTKEKARENLAELLEALVQVIASYGKDISSYTVLQLVDALKNKPHYDYALQKAQKISNVRIYKRHNEVSKKQEPLELDF